MTAVASDCTAKLVLCDSDVAFLRKMDTSNLLSKSRHLWPHTGCEFKVTSGLHHQRNSSTSDKSFYFSRSFAWLLGRRNSSDPVSFDEESLLDDDVAFLQYTSGSTGQPKGVMIKFAAIHANIKLIDHAWKQAGLSSGADGVPDGVPGFSWLPQYHDLGLIYSGIARFALGHRMHMMSPLTFIKNPLLWIQLMSRHKVCNAAAPCFAYNLVSRKFEEAKSRRGAGNQEPIPGLDLSCILHLSIGAEPLHLDTKKKFDEQFTTFGLRQDWLVSHYGLAEHVVGCCWIHGLHVSRSTSERPGSFVAIGSRETFAPGLVVKIVDSETRLELPDGETGELWLAGPSVAAGYFGKPELSEQTFNGKLAVAHANNYVGPASSFLKTGDLAFFENDMLFFCGRIKDLIIVNGANHYPQDIESVVQDATPSVRPGCVAAFSGNDHGGDDESLEVLFEIRKKHENDVKDILGLVRSAVIARTGLVPSRCCHRGEVNSQDNKW